MCVQEGEQVDQDNNMEELDNRRISWPLHCDLLHSQMDNTEKDSSFRITAVNSFPVSILLLHLLFLLFLHVCAIFSFFFCFSFLSLYYKLDFDF
jgi:hypothetical protein